MFNKIINSKIFHFLKRLKESTVHATINTSQSDGVDNAMSSLLNATKYGNRDTFLENLLECVPGNIYWKNKEGYWLGCNNLTVMEMGLNSEQDIEGKNDFDLFNNKAQAKQIRENDLEVIHTGKVLNIEETVTLSNGKIKTYRVIKMPLKDSKGDVIGIIGNSLDITELKETQAALLEAKEKAEAANLAKDAFMENMSHDFKTPLNGMYGAVQLLANRKDEFPDDIKELITIQEKSTTRLTKLIEAILDFKKIDSGTLEIVQEELNLFEIIESVVEGLKFQLKTKPVDILIYYPPDVPRHLIGDAHCVTSIVLNLMSNAVKFTDKGHISISVNVISKDGNNVVLKIAVEDTGEGIAKDKHQEIFERFHRLELSNKGLREGHGIGLSVVKELVEKLNGKIEIESELGKGTKFTVHLPFQVLNMSFFVSEWERSHPTVHILVVSDKITSTEIQFNQFEQAFISKTDSAIAINKIEEAIKDKNPFEILIVDDEVADPLELINKLNKNQKYSALMKILSLQPKQDRDKKWYDKAREMGCFDFITKPVLPSELDKKIVEAWKNWKKKNH